MFDVVDELQRCEHISRLQSSQLYALVRAAMSLQYGAEKRAKHRARHPRGALRRRRPRVACGVNSAALANLLRSSPHHASPSRTPSRSSPPWGRHATKATAMRVDAEKIKAHIYRYESLAGENRPIPDYQVQYPALIVASPNTGLRRGLSRRRARRYRRRSRRLRGALGILVGVGRTYAGMVGRWGRRRARKGDGAASRIFERDGTRWRRVHRGARAKGTTADPKRTGATAGTGKGTGTGVRGASKPDVAGQPGVGHSAVGQRGVTGQPSVGQPGVAGQPGVGQQGVAGQPGVGQQGVSRFASPGVVPGG